MSLPSLEDLRHEFHGGLSDAHQALAVEFAELRHCVHEVMLAVDRLDTSEDHYTTYINGIAGAAGAITLVAAGPRQGYEWKIERITVITAGGAAGIAAALYVGEVTPANCRWVTDQGAFVSADLGNGIWLGPQETTRVTVSGAPVGAAITAALQIVSVKL